MKYTLSLGSFFTILMLLSTPSFSSHSHQEDTEMYQCDWIIGPSMKLAKSCLGDFARESNSNTVTLRTKSDLRSLKQICIFKMTSHDQISFFLSTLPISCQSITPKRSEIITPNMRVVTLTNQIPDGDFDVLYIPKETKLTCEEGSIINDTLFSADCDFHFISPNIRFEEVKLDFFTRFNISAPEECHRPGSIENICFYPASKEYVAILKKLYINFDPNNFSLLIEGLNIGKVDFTLVPKSGDAASR